MKTMKKMMVLVLSVLMVLGSTMVTSFAAGDGTITVTKNFKGQTYTLYQLFDAKTVAGRTDDGDGISYKLMSGKSDLKATVEGTVVDGAQWFDVDAKGNVTLKQGATLFTETFNKWAVAYGKATGSAITAASDNDANVKWTGLDEGYYFVSTTTGSLVTVDSIKPNVEIEDKNTVPTVDKTITGASSISDQGKKALAQVGTDVEYTATVKVGKGSKNLKFHDKMDTGLTFKGNSSVTVEANPAITGTWYTIESTPAEGDTLTILFKDGIAENTVITIKYKATVNADAVQTPLKNEATVSYGDNNTFSEESETEVYNAEIAVLKFKGAKANKEYLDGAGFVLKNADGKFYKLDNGVVTWVDSKDSADEHISGTDGKVAAFTGLADGTYTLVEKTVPEGYNTADDTSITIAQGSYTAANLSQVAEVENFAGTELPSTGGMGTTILYIIGGVLVVVCGIMLVAKKRTSNK